MRDLADREQLAPRAHRRQPRAAVRRRAPRARQRGTRASPLALVRSAAPARCCEGRPEIRPRSPLARARARQYLRGSAPRRAGALRRRAQLASILQLARTRGRQPQAREFVPPRRAPSFQTESARPPRASAARQAARAAARARAGPRCRCPRRVLLRCGRGARQGGARRARANNAASSLAPASRV